MPTSLITYVQHGFANKSVSYSSEINT